MPNLTGSCNCGAIKYGVSGDIRIILNCHCNTCRKMNGSAFSTYVAVSNENFELSSGTLKRHKVTDKAEKNFCGECGSPIFNSNPQYPGITILHLGSLDNMANLEPTTNIYCDSRLDWLGKLLDIPNLQEGL